jgi:hypothetical protein
MDEDFDSAEYDPTEGDFEPGESTGTTETASEFSGMDRETQDRYGRHAEEEPETEQSPDSGVYVVEGNYDAETGTITVEGVELQGSDRAGIAEITRKFQEGYEGLAYSTRDEWNGVIYESNYYTIGANLRIETIIISVEEYPAAEGSNDDDSEEAKTEPLSFTSPETEGAVSAGEEAVVAEEPIVSFWDKIFETAAEEVAAPEEEQNSIESPEPVLAAQTEVILQDPEPEAKTELNFTELFWIPVDSTNSEKVTVKVEEAAGKNSEPEKAAVATDEKEPIKLVVAIEPTIEPVAAKTEEKTENQAKTSPIEKIPTKPAKIKSESKSAITLVVRQRSPERTSAPLKQPVRQEVPRADKSIAASRPEATPISLKLEKSAPVGRVRETEIEDEVAAPEAMAEQERTEPTAEAPAAAPEPTVEIAKNIAEKAAPETIPPIEPAEEREEIKKDESDSIPEVTAKQSEAKLPDLSLIELVQRPVEQNQAEQPEKISATIEPAKQVKQVKTPIKLVKRQAVKNIAAENIKKSLTYEVAPKPTEQYQFTRQIKRVIKVGPQLENRAGITLRGQRTAISAEERDRLESNNRIARIPINKVRRNIPARAAIRIAA